MTAYARRQFAGGAIQTTVPLAVGSSDASFTLASSTNWPDGSVGNFEVVIDAATPEKIQCSSRSGLVVTVASGGRGYDGTSAVNHPAGCAIQCVHIAQDDDEANQLVAQTFGQSGATKGDLWYVNNPTSPTTLARLPLAPNGGLYSAAGGVPATSLAGSTGQLLQSAGSSVPTFNSTLLQGVHGTGAGSGTTLSSSYAILSGTQSTANVVTNTMALVLLYAVVSNNTASDFTLVSVSVSGATVIAATDDYAISYQQPAGGGLSVGLGTSMVFGAGLAGALNPGTNTFKAVARVAGGGTATISDCLLTVIPLN